MNKNVTTSKVLSIDGKIQAPNVEFGDPRRDNALKAFPFFYNFINYPYNQGDVNAQTGITSVTGAGAEGPDGLLIPAGGVLQVPIVMANDTNFHLLYIKYGAFLSRSLFGTAIAAANTISQDSNNILANDERITFLNISNLGGINTAISYFVVTANASTFQVSLTSGGAVIDITIPAPGVSALVEFTLTTPETWIGSREYLVAPQTNLNGTTGGTQFTAQVSQRIPFFGELDVSIYMSSSAARDLYGGLQRAAQDSSIIEVPLPILDVQGSNDGCGMVRTPFQLTKGSTVFLKFKSRSAFSLRVYGHLFGYKITL